MTMASSLSSLDRPYATTWCATYPPKGGAEALATVTEQDGGFDVSVAAVGWARKRSGTLARRSREPTLEAARLRADALAAELLGREVFAKWREVAAEGH
jgi:hypothetical protein